MKKLFSILFIVGYFHSYSQVYIKLVPPMELTEKYISTPNYGGLVESIMDVFKSLASITCNSNIKFELEKKIEQERAKISYPQEYTVAINYFECKVDFYKGKNTIISSDLSKLTLFSVTLIPSKVEIGTGKPAIIVTYQSSNGRWYGGGPIQWVLMSELTEDKVLDLLYTKEKGSPLYIKSIGKFKLYALPYYLKSYETDVRLRLKNEYNIQLDF